jgi:hypothetical protein
MTNTLGNLETSQKEAFRHRINLAKLLNLGFADFVDEL